MRGEGSRIPIRGLLPLVLSAQGGAVQEKCGCQTFPAKMSRPLIDATFLGLLSSPQLETSPGRCSHYQQIEVIPGTV